MIIDTQKRTIGIQLRKLIFLILLVAFIVVLYTTDILATPVNGITRSMVALAATAAYILGYVFSFLRDTNYFSFNSNSSKLVFKYYSLKPLSSEQNLLEINKAEFKKFEIIKKLGGLSEYLVLYKSTPQGMAKYPPISISILSKSEKEKLIQELGAIR